jgi:FkbM family methyltransferase
LQWRTLSDEKKIVATDGYSRHLISGITGHNKMNFKCVIKAITPPIAITLLHGIRNGLERRTPSVQPNVEVSTKELGRQGTVDVECQGLLWRLDTQSCISRMMIEQGVWEAETTRVIHDLVKPGMRVLSVGANFGYYALLMAKIVGATGRVWAFEPTIKYREQLQHNIRANHLDRIVSVVPYGLSDSNISATIDLTPQSASMHYSPQVERIGSETILLKPLDQVMEELGIDRVDFISMDIDGHEAAFLRGARQTLCWK